VDSMYRPLHYSNAGLKSIGWSQRVATQDAIETTFSYLKEQMRRSKA